MARMVATAAALVLLTTSQAMAYADLELTCTVGSLCEGEGPGLAAFLVQESFVQTSKGWPGLGALYIDFPICPDHPTEMDKEMRNAAVYAFQAESPCGICFQDIKEMYTKCQDAEIVRFAESHRALGRGNVFNQYELAFDENIPGFGRLGMCPGSAGDGDAAEGRAYVPEIPESALKPLLDCEADYVKLYFELDLSCAVPRKGQFEALVQGAGAYSLECPTDVEEGRRRLQSTRNKKTVNSGVR